MINYTRLLFISLLLLSACDNKPKQKNTSKNVNIPISQQSVDSVTQIAKTHPTVTPTELSFAEQLSNAALERTTHDITYDGSYIKIAYPMGDVPDAIGVCTDVIIRSYRELGIDLQQLLHEDIKENFKHYPSQKRWGLSQPDTNIDHRRVPNLRVFFSRKGESLAVTKNPKDYLTGDIVTWNLNDKIVHIGIVSGEISFNNPERHLIIHNIGDGTELGDILFHYEITGHYRYGFTNN